jgi:conserved hypothetical protein
LSYSAVLKREIFNKEISNKEEKYAELFGIFSAKKSFKKKGIHFSTENVSLAKRVYSNLRDVTKMDIQIKYQVDKKLGTHKIYEVISLVTKNSEKEYKHLLNKMLSLKNFFEKKTEEQLSGIIRGFFLSCGYVKSPEKGYALDFFVDTEDSATYLYYLFKNMKKRVFQTDKKNKSLVYLRNSEDILDIIFLIGGVTSFFEFEEVVVNKEIRNRINRNINWEIANETKKLSASEKQIKMINFIEEKLGLENLTDVLKETAYLRLENGDLSLQELADLMEISKSGIKNRFRRLETVYKSLVEES